MKVLKDRIAHWSFVGLLLAFAATSFYAPGASAGTQVPGTGQTEAQCGVSKWP